MSFCLDVVYHDYGSFMLLVEDTIVITDKGCELLTGIKKSLYG
jgi:Xaa-Pro aminopeptidase